MGGAATQVLLKTQALELIRLVLPQGKAVPPRTVRGELTVHCLEGELVLAFGGAACHLGPGQLVLLPAGTEHAIHAASDAAALLTVQVPGGAWQRGPVSESVSTDQ
jgi:quercetin dioxygenase-like cupin family protein